MRINEFNESQQQCPECGGPSFSNLLLAEKQDACYAKVKSRYKVWPSAYASGALVQCRKKGAANWGNKSKNESVAEGSMYGDQEVSWEKGGRRAPTGAFRNPANQPKGMTRAVDSKGRTQQQWIQLVKSKFPNAKITQAKMIDGPCRATLPDGKTLQWNPEPGSLKEFLNTQAVAQDPGVEREKDVDVIFFGRMPRDYQAEEAWAALEEVLPQEYPPGSERAQYKVLEVSRNGGAVVTTKPLSIAKKLVATFNGYGIKSRINGTNESVAEDYNAEYDDEAGMADNNLETLERAVEGIDDLIQSGDNLPEWCQEKIAVAKSMLVTVWDYMKSEEDRGAVPELNEEFDLIESIVNQIADQNGVDPEMVWEDLESLTEDELYAFAVTSQLNEDWQKANKSDRTDGMSRKAVKAYRRAHPGSKLQTAVTTKPSKLKKGSKASKRRKSYCSRSRGQMKMHNISCAKTPDKAICKARRRWNC